MEKRLGIVLPTIGREGFLDKSISSLLEQSVQADEFLVFDNSVSQDLKKKSKYGNHEKIRWVQSGTEQLCAIDSWNTAILSSKCEYVTVAGDDDLFMNNYIAEAKKIIQRVDLGFLRAVVINENDKEVRTLPFPKESLLSSRQFRSYRFGVGDKISFFVPGSVFKKEIFEKVGGYIDSKLPGAASSDELLYFQMSAITKEVGLSEKVCWKYRIHSGQIANVGNYKDYVKVISKIWC